MLQRRLVRAARRPGAALVLTASHVGVHRAAYDRAGPHDRDLDRQVLEICGTRAANHLDLRPALDLEQPHRVAPADAVVHRGVLEVDAREVGWRSLPHGDPLDALFHQRQHAERQEVDFDEARVVAGIFVPLTHDAVFHGGPLERHDLHERPARDDHPAHVLGNVPRQPRDLLGELTQLFPERRAFAPCESGKLVQFVRQPAGSSVRQFRDLLDFARRQIQRLTDLAHRRAQPVGGERADEPDVLVPVPRVDPPDQRFADLAWKIEVDVRHRGEGLAQEPPDEEPGGYRIDVREAEQVAHDGGDGRAAAATREQAALRPARAAPHIGGDLAREVEQIVIDEKEPAEPVVLDQSQFLGEPPLRLVAVQGAGGGALFEPRAAQLGQRLWGGRALGAVEVGKAISQIAREIEPTAALRQRQTVSDSIWTVKKQRLDFIPRTQEELAVRMTHVVRAVERGAVPDRHQHIVQPVPLSLVVMHVASCHDTKVHIIRESFQRPGEGEISPDVVPLQLDDEVLLPEHRTAPLGEAAGGGRAVAPQYAGQETVAAPRQHDEPRVPGFERGEIEPRVAPICTAEMSLRNQPAEVRVPLRSLREQRHVGPVQ